MPHRAQRRRNREAREAPLREAAELEALVDFADEELLLRREFVAEAVKSKGLVSLTLRPRGESNYLEVYGGEITFDGTSKLYGDSIVNNWKLPHIEGFRARFDKDSAVIAPLDPSLTSMDVTNIWLRTSGDLLHPDVSTNEEGIEENITVTKDGLTMLTQTIGHGAISESLQYIEGQLFTPQ